MKKNKKNLNEAFTLIEVLVAMLVLAIGLLGLAGITVVVLRSNTLSQQISEATNIASTLMEDLRRTTGLPDCQAANAYNIASIPSSCDILHQSGIARQSDAAFFPPLANQSTPSTACGVPGLLDGRGTSGNSFTFDAISGNFTGRTDFASNATLCTSDAPRGSPYIRYYRTMVPAGGGASERRMVVVVLWKDKFGKWRNVKLDTRRSSN